MLKSHFTETRLSFIQNKQDYREVDLPNDGHALVLFDNGEVWFYYDKDYNLTNIRAY